MSSTPPRRILALTSIRSDYDLLAGLYRRLEADTDIDFRLLVSGAHLSPTFGHTVELIERDGLPILMRIETLLDSDSPCARLKSASILLQNAIDAVAAFAPDLIMYPGDREDTAVGALLGASLGIPTVHFFGGDHVADGYVDNPVRHAVSKLSSVHFVSTEKHRQRLLALGEDPRRIFVVGSVALDRIHEHDALALPALRERFDLTEGFDRFALVIFHPTGSEDDAAHLRNILGVLREERIDAFVSAPNSDPGSRHLIDVLDAEATRPSFVFYRNLPRELFLSVYKRCAFIIGNSSSGVTEAASNPVAAINVGARQTGRAAGENVVFCGGGRGEILGAVRRVCSPEFQEFVAKVTNPYGDGRSADRAYRLIRRGGFAALQRKDEDPLDAARPVAVGSGS